jgi:SAM-dependent methyltransferase
VSNQDRADPSQFAASTGQVATASSQPDAHFEANRPEYEAMLRSVPFEPGSHVLDAGCGSGGFVPLLAALVGPAGQITALDLAPENVAVVRERITSWGLPCPVQTQVGTLLDLPFPARHFDAVWCSNTTQYLSDAELAAALRELRRVVRPGGLVAIKDADGGAVRFDPTPSSFMERRRDAGNKATGRVGMPNPGLRAPMLRTWLREAGFAEVWARSTVIERWAPLRVVEQQFWGDALRLFAGQALQLELPAADLTLWRELSEPAGAAAFVARPDFYCREVNVVAVGRVV